MIRSFKHRGLKRLYERGVESGVPPQMLAKLRVILADLDSAEGVRDMGRPGYGLHLLRGDRKNFWSVKVTNNFRVIFRFEKEPSDVDLVDYH